MSGNKIALIILGILLIFGGIFSIFAGIIAGSEIPPEDWSEEEVEQYRRDRGPVVATCLIIGIIILIVGFVLLYLGVKMDKKQEMISTQQPLVMMQQPYQQQPSTIESKVDAKLQKSSMPNFCPNCGSQRGASNFCPNCGYRYV